MDSDAEQASRLFDHLHKSRQALNNANQCFFIKCKEKPIGAHSVSKNAHLKGLCDAKNNLIGIKQEFRDQGRSISYAFDNIGVNKASKFWGFCKTHDEIFNPIDTMTPDSPVTTEMHFLLAMRSLAREWCTRQSLCESLESEFDVTDDALSATYVEFLKGLDDMRVMRGFFNDTFARGRYDTICGVSRIITTKPSIAASSAINPEWGVNGDQINNIMTSQVLDEKLMSIVGLFVNVVPLTDSRTLLSIQCKTTHRSRVGGLMEFDGYNEDSLKNVFSNMLLENSENAFFSSAFINSLKPAERDWILNKFGANADPISTVPVGDSEEAMSILLSLIAPLDTFSEESVSIFY